MLERKGHNERDELEPDDGCSKGEESESRENVMPGRPARLDDGGEARRTNEEAEGSLNCKLHASDGYQAPRSLCRRTEREGEHVGQGPACPERHVELRRGEERKVLCHLGAIRCTDAAGEEDERESRDDGEGEADWRETAGSARSGSSG